MLKVPQVIAHYNEDGKTYQESLKELLKLIIIKDISKEVSVAD